MRLNRLFAAAVGVFLTAIAADASATPLNIGAGNNPLGPEYIITYNADGTFSTAVNPVYASNPGAFDGGDDTYFGVVNNNANVLLSIFLSSTLDIFGFDGDGLTAFGLAGNANDVSGYGGPVTYFQPIDVFHGTVIFGASGIAPGGTEIFSLEEAVALNTFVIQPGVPEMSTWAMMLFGFAGLAFLMRRYHNQSFAPATA